MIVSIISYSLSQVIKHAMKNKSGQPIKQFRASSKKMIILFKLCMYYRGFTKFGIKVSRRLQFLEYLRTLHLKFTKARTKTEQTANCADSGQLQF